MHEQDPSHQTETAWAQQQCKPAAFSLRAEQDSKNQTVKSELPVTDVAAAGPESLT